jgi:hypothetical protein
MWQAWRLDVTEHEGERLLFWIAAKKYQATAKL